MFYVSNDFALHCPILCNAIIQCIVTKGLVRNQQGGGSFKWRGRNIMTLPQQKD